MDISKRLAISYYKSIAPINEAHKVFLVQHLETKKICIRKTLEIYNIDVYRQLYQTPVRGIPTILQYCEDEGQLIVIEEYVSGNTLRERIQQGSLNVNLILGLILDLCDILGQLHTMKPAIVHRDIKPSNVMVTSYDRAVLLDFNAAKNTHPESTEDTVLLGSQGYAAPEQYGFGASSPQTDIYSLGIMLREMLESINYTDPFFESVIRKCTQLEPSKRYGNIFELKETILKQISPIKATATGKPDKLSFALPGFRSGLTWRTLIAVPCYLFIAWVCLTLQVNGAYGLNLWVQRIFSLAIALFNVFGIFNYLNVQSMMPLCKSRNPVIRILGIIILNAAVSFIMLMILTLLVFLMESA